MARKDAPPKVKDASALESVAPKRVRVEDLYLDPKNPRLAEDGFGIEDQGQILKVLWKERAVNEIVNSIATSGYWPQEVLFAAKEEGKLVVVEGNRRLSAVKLLLSRDLQKEVGATGVPNIEKSRRDSLLHLPVIEYTRKQLWEYVGFKHVNGPQDWDSGLHPPDWTKYVRVVGRIIPMGEKGSCHEATAKVQPRVQTSSC